MNFVSAFLKTGFLPRVFKITVIQAQLTKTPLDPDDVASDRPISSLPFIFKILCRNNIYFNQDLDPSQYKSYFGQSH